MKRRYVTEEYGIEFEVRERRWVLLVSELVWTVGLILVGAFGAWLIVF